MHVTMTAAAPAGLMLEERLLLGAIVYLSGLKLSLTFWLRPAGAAVHVCRSIPRPPRQAET
jgi:hypothetical protein